MKRANPLRREIERGANRRGDLCGELVPPSANDLVGWLALVEPAGVLGHRLVAPRAHVGEDLRDRIVDAIFESRRAIEHRRGLERAGA